MQPIEEREIFLEFIQSVNWKKEAEENKKRVLIRKNRDPIEEREIFLEFIQSVNWKKEAEENKKNNPAIEPWVVFLVEIKILLTFLFTNFSPVVDTGVFSMLILCQAEDLKRFGI